MPPTFNTALVLDGSVIVHGVNIFRADEHPPIISPNDHNELRYLGNDAWSLFANDQLVRSYKTTDLRISLVWRARCFSNNDEKADWAKHEREITVDQVLAKFLADMWDKGLVPRGTKPAPIDLAIMIVKNYISYPSDDDSIVPVNYCMLGKVVPSLKGLLSYVCE